MLGWIIAVLTLLWGVYQYFHPRVLQRVEYEISIIRERDHLIGFGYLAAIEDPKKHERRSNLTGVKLSIHSTGGKAVTGLLIHIRLSRSIEHQEISTDEEYKVNNGKGTEEIQIKVPTLNPTDVVNVAVFCVEELSGEDISDILVNHRVSLSEGKAKKVKKL